MAKLDQIVNRNFDELISVIENGIMTGSVSASLEGKTDFISGSARCSVRVFERYS